MQHETISIDTMKKIVERVGNEVKIVFVGDDEKEISFQGDNGLSKLIEQKRNSQRE